MNKEDRKDLVERLRNTPTERTWDSVGRPYDYPKHLPQEAADEIVRLEGEVVILRADRENLHTRVRELYSTVAALMAKLADLLDEDHFAACEEIARTGGVSPPASSAEITRLRRELAEARKALEPFALMSSEGVIKAETGYVSIKTCAEYFHAARAALRAEEEGK